MSKDQLLGLDLYLLPPMARVDGTGCNGYSDCFHLRAVVGVLWKDKAIMLIQLVAVGSMLAGMASQICEGLLPDFG